MGVRGNEPTLVPSTLVIPANPSIVIPAKAGTQGEGALPALGSRVRGEAKLGKGQ